MTPLQPKSTYIFCTTLLKNFADRAKKHFFLLYLQNNRKYSLALPLFITGAFAAVAYIAEHLIEFIINIIGRINRVA